MAKTNIVMYVLSVIFHWYWTWENPAGKWLKERSNKWLLFSHLSIYSNGAVHIYKTNNSVPLIPYFQTERQLNHVDMGWWYNAVPTWSKCLWSLDIIRANIAIMFPQICPNVTEVCATFIDDVDICTALGWYCLNVNCSLGTTDWKTKQYRAIGTNDHLPYTVKL